MTLPNNGDDEPRGRRPVLADHTRVRSRFIPPIVSAIPLTELRWVHEVLPELLWLALLNQAYGHQQGADTALALSNAALAVTGAESHWFGPCSAYGTLNARQQAALIARLRSSGEL